MIKILKKTALVIIDWMSVILFKNDQVAARILANNRKRLVKEAFEFPSIINNGHLHIEQTIALAEFLGIKDRKGIVIDIGAANGIITNMLRENFSQSNVYGFEPLADAFARLQEATNGLERIKIFNKAIGSKSGQSIINRSANAYSSSLLPIETHIKDSYLAENLSKAGEQTVIVSTLDEEINSVDLINLIKIDVQGFELEVLKGSTSMLKRTSLIVLELQNHGNYIGAPQYYTLDAFLRENGFVLYNIIPSIRRNMKLYEWDAIYVNSELDKKFNDLLN